jgi:Zn-finger nucleic acid-binding protein
MITVELQDVETDYCTECGGIWLDSGELELLFGNQKYAKQVINSFELAEKCSEKKRKCPICGKKMLKIIADSESSLLIDKCQKGHGLWFDKSELNQLFDTVQLDADNKIRDLLTKVFSQ